MVNLLGRRAQMKILTARLASEYRFWSRTTLCSLPEALDGSCGIWLKWYWVWDPLFIEAISKWKFRLHRWVQNIVSNQIPYMVCIFPTPNESGTSKFKFEELWNSNAAMTWQSHATPRGSGVKSGNFQILKTKFVQFFLFNFNLRLILHFESKLTDSKGKLQENFKGNLAVISETQREASFEVRNQF